MKQVQFSAVRDGEWPCRFQQACKTGDGPSPLRIFGGVEEAREGRNVAGVLASGEPSGAHWDHCAQCVRKPPGSLGGTNDTGHVLRTQVQCIENVVDVLVIMQQQALPVQVVQRTLETKCWTFHRCSSRTRLLTGFLLCNDRCHWSSQCSIDSVIDIPVVAQRFLPRSHQDEEAKPSQAKQFPFNVFVVS